MIDIQRVVGMKNFSKFDTYLVRMEKMLLVNPLQFYSCFISPLCLRVKHKIKFYYIYNIYYIYNKLFSLLFSSIYLSKIISVKL